MDNSEKGDQELNSINSFYVPGLRLALMKENRNFDTMIFGIPQLNEVLLDNLLKENCELLILTPDSFLRISEVTRTKMLKHFTKVNEAQFEGPVKLRRYQFYRRVFI